jgi:hypothetical protein
LRQHGGPGKRFLGKLPGIGGRRNRNLSPAKAERLAKDPRVYALSPDREVEAYGEAIPWGVVRIGVPTTTFLDPHFGPPPPRALSERPGILKRKPSSCGGGKEKPP